MNSDKAPVVASAKVDEVNEEVEQADEVDEEVKQVDEVDEEVEQADEVDEVREVNDVETQNQAEGEAKAETESEATAHIAVTDSVARVASAASEASVAVEHVGDLAKDRQRASLTETGVAVNLPPQSTEPPDSDPDFTTEPFPTEQSPSVLPSLPGAYPISTFNTLQTAVQQTDEEEDAPLPMRATCSTLQASTREGNLPSNPADTSLAVANPISLDLPSAEQIHDSEVKATTADRRRTRKATMIGFLVFGLAVVLIGCPLLVTFLLLGNNAKDGGGDRGKNETFSPTQSPTLSLEEHILTLLPNYTLDAMRDGPESPQSLAYEWMVEDPALSTYLDWRILQRFALATFYFATGGKKYWYNSTNWLDYGHHECDWYAREFCSHLPSNCPPIPFPNPCMEQDPKNPKSGIYKYLWQWNNGLRGTLPPEIFWLTSLITTSTDVNSLLGGTLPSTIGLLSQIRVFTFGGAAFTRRIPTEIGLMTNLQIWVTSGSKMTGVIPTEIGLLSNNLFRLHLDSNNLSGSIPTEIGRLTAMQDMLLFSNQLTSAIPTEFGLLTNMANWDISSNCFSGFIPSEIGNLSNLFRLWLPRNDLRGTIPLEIGALVSNNASLKLADFSGNGMLSGTIPSSLCSPSLNVLLFDCTPSLLCGCNCTCLLG